MKEFLISGPHEFPRIFQVSNITDYVKLTTWLGTNDQLIFRGQRSVDWPLVPSVGRNVDRSILLKNEQSMFHEFKREAVAFVDRQFSSEWQWLALAQHNGLPTRLLDWTQNPLAGLFFAVNKPATPETAGVVWSMTLDEDVILSVERDPCPFNISQTFVYFPDHNYPFIQAQQAVFTVHHAKSVADSRSPRFVPLEEQELYVSSLSAIRIPSDAFALMRYGLSRLGVSYSTLFPGLGGIAMRIRYKNILCDDEPSAPSPAV